MNEALWAWVFFVVLLIWRWASRRDGCQECLRKTVGCLTPLVQWYVLMGLGLILALARTFLDIYKYDYKMAHNLDPDFIADQLIDKDVATTELPDWLRMTSLLAPLVGVAGFILSFYQTARLIWCCVKANREDPDCDKKFRWRMSHAVDQLLIILGVPMVFIVMSMRAVIRSWAVITGSYCWHQVLCDNWERTRELEAALGSMDTMVATAFQFFAMWEFARLVGLFIADSELKYGADESTTAQKTMNDYRKILMWASVLAVYAFAVIGFINALFGLATTCLLKMLPEQSMAENHGFIMVQKQLAPMFTFATVLCVINMFIISKVPPLVDLLGNVTLKFHGTRMMLLVVQIQPKILDALTSDSDLFLKAKSFAEDHEFEGLQHRMQEWKFNREQSNLLNVSLLLYWCFIVSFMNVCFWAVSSGRIKKLMEKARRNSFLTNNPTEPLLNGA